MSDEIIIPGAGTINTDPIPARFELRQGAMGDWKNAGILDTRSGEPLLGFDSNGEVVLKIGDGSNAKTWDELKGFSTTELAEIHKYMEEHGGAWDAISLASNEEDEIKFVFSADKDGIRYKNETSKLENQTKITPNYLVFGTTAYETKNDSTNIVTTYIPDQIVSGIAYRFWKDDSSKPGSADYSKNQMLQALGKAAFAVGCNNKSVANYATTFGSHNINGAYGGFVTGTSNIALGDYSYGTNIEGVEGFESHETDSQYSFMVSRNGTAAADLSFVEGESTKQGFNTYPDLAFNKVGYSGTADEAFHEAWRGLTTKNKFSAALGCFSHVGGMNSVTGHAVSFAFGDECYTGGLCSMAFGKKSETKGQTAFAINHNTKAYGANSFSMGLNTKVTGSESFVGGGSAYDGDDIVYYSLVSGKAAFGFGSGNIVEADNGVAFGWHNQIDSTSKGTVLLGNSNDSIGGEWSLAAGTTNHIRGNNSVAFGSGCDIFANCGLASGNDSRVHCYGGQALGIRAISYGEGQVVVGRYNTLIENANKSQDRAKAYFIVGIGKDESNTKNGLVVYGDGHAEVGTASTNDLAVATYGQIKDLKGFTTIVNNEDWVETRVDDVLIQATKKLILPANTKIKEVEGYSGLYSLSYEINAEYAQNLTNIIAQGSYITSDGSLFVLSSTLENNTITIYFKPLHGMSTIEDPYLGTYISLNYDMNISILLTK